MRTTISFALSPTELKKTSRLAKTRGFSTTSDYLRFLLEQDDTDLISEHELVTRAKQVDKLHASGQLIRAKSMNAFMR